MFFLKRISNCTTGPMIATILATGLSIAAGQSTPLEGSTIGTPRTLGSGVTESVAAIMAREATHHSLPTGGIRQIKPRMVRDGTGVVQNAASPLTSRWPATGASPLVESTTPSVPLSPQTVGLGFLGAQVSDSGYVPPDSMADVGHNQILVCVNGRIRTFNKSGVADGALNATTDNFFASVLGGSSTSDPRVRFDRLSRRWFITMITVNTPNFVLIAVSSVPAITSASNFTFFSFQADSTNFGDYDTLGVDAHALYIGVNVFSSTAFVNTTGFVVNKANLLSGTLIVTTFSSLITGPRFNKHGPYTPQGVNNDDPSSTTGYFIGVDDTSSGTLVVRRISNPGGTPTISANLNITVPATVIPMGGVPALGSTSSLDDLDDRLFGARMHNGSLWTAHNIQVNASGVASSTGGRDGARWYQINNMTGTPTLVQSGTLFDSAGSNPRSFWIPACAMSGQGHMALGCSVAGAGEHAEIAVAGRLVSDAPGTIQSPMTAVASVSTYNSGLQSGVYRWGDFSVTTVDPNDDMTMWTVQEYCNANNSWGVQVIQLKAPSPATPVIASPASVVQGQSSVSVVIAGTSLSGSGFFDPGPDTGGPGYSNRIAAVVNGGGVTVNGVTFNQPTNIMLNLSVAGNAALGARTVTVTNPDSQSATSSSGILTIIAPAQLAISPAGHDFGVQTTGTTVQTTFVVTNVGGAALSGTATVQVAGAFTVVSGSPFNLAGNGATNVVVGFTPPSEGTFSNNVVFASNGGGSTNALVGTGAIVPVASFSGSPTNGLAPLTVTFADASTGTITNRFWSFGDGGTTNTLSTNVVYVYAAAGTNTVRLTVSGPVGVSTNSRPNYIVATWLWATQYQSAAQIAAAPTSLDFGTVASGAVSQRVFAVSNTGGTAVTNVTVAMQTAGGPFSLPGQTNFDLPVYGATNVTVRFAPSVVGTFSNAVVFATANGGSATNGVTGRAAMHRGSLIMFR